MLAREQERGRIVGEGEVALGWEYRAFNLRVNLIVKENQEMKNGIKTLNFTLLLILVLTFAIAGLNRKKEPDEPKDVESVRAELREQVDSGKLTKEEAIVRLAETQAYLGSGKKYDKKYEKNISPELEALGKELKEKLASGEISEYEAKAAWIEAAKGEYGTEKASYSGKETK